MRLVSSTLQKQLDYLLSQLCCGNKAVRVPVVCSGSVYQFLTVISVYERLAVFFLKGIE